MLSQDALRGELRRIIESGWPDTLIGTSSGESESPGAKVRRFLDGDPISLSFQVRLSRTVYKINSGRLARRKAAINQGRLVRGIDVAQLVTPPKPTMKKVQRLEIINGKPTVVVALEASYVLDQRK